MSKTLTELVHDAENTMDKVRNILQDIEGDEDLVETATRVMKAFERTIEERNRLKAQLEALSLLMEEGWDMELISKEDGYDVAAELADPDDPLGKLVAKVTWHKVPPSDVLPRLIELAVKYKKHRVFEGGVSIPSEV